MSLSATVSCWFNVTVADQVVGLTGQSSTGSVGEPSLTSNPVSNTNWMFFNCFSRLLLTPADVMGLSGVSATASVGAINSPADLVLGIDWSFSNRKM